MIQALAVAVLVLVVRQLLGGTAIDLGPTVAVVAPGVLALGLGWGLLSRAKWPYLADSLGVALLVPARGLFCDLLVGVLPADATWVPHVAAVLSLGPVGFVLGRQLSSVASEGVGRLACGWCLGELAVFFGLASWLPGVFTGFVAAGVFAALVEMGRHRRTHREGASEDRPGWEAFVVGLGLTILLASLTRLVPAYVAPPVNASGEVVLALLVPAVLVAWPTRILSGGDRLRRVLLAAGCLTLGWALWRTRESLTLYLYGEAQVALSMEMHQHVDRVLEWGLPGSPWRMWLKSFVGWPAAALGLCLGALGRGGAGPFACGVGVGWIAQSFIAVDPDYAPERLLAAASGIVAVGCLVAFQRRAIWLLPVGALALLLDTSEDRPAYGEIRRVGETGVETFHRTLLADVRLYRTAGPGINQPDARSAYARSFTRREPFLVLGAEGSAEPEPVEDRGHEHEHGASDPADVPPDPGHLGLRIAGADAHAGHDPFGPEGSVGRLLRLFALPGPAHVSGIGAEIVAGDMRDAGLEELTASSPVPFSNRTGLVLFGEVGSSGFVGGVVPDPVAAARRLLPGSLATVVIAPERAEWPGGGVVLAQEHLARLAAALAPAGRCLAWIDTTSLGVRELAGRLAAFGAVFGARSAAFVEMRELDPPFVLLLGWIDAAGRPTASELSARLPTAARTGRRSRLADLDDLSAHLLLDGHGLSELAGSAAIHRRSQPIFPTPSTLTGWAAVAQVFDPEAQLGSVVDGADTESSDGTALFGGLAAHGRYSYHVAELGSSMITRFVSDLDWQAFDDEVGFYARAADVDRHNPLLHLAVAALLEPLARSGDYGRFHDVFTAVGGATMENWRLALLQAYVLDNLVEHAAAQLALERARAWQAPVEGD